MPISSKEFDRLRKIKESNEKWIKDEKPSNGKKKEKFWLDKRKINLI